MSEPHVEKQKPVPPFVQFCCAAVPMVFDDSLSYYEALCAMWKYLDETVKVINNNALVTEDFIAKVNELHEYVEHYFDNLDVQEEINNKLDEMAEAGTLQEIITQYIQANVAWTFDTVADMKSATNLVAGSYAQTLGYHSKDDGGAGLYYITDTGTANEKDVIAVDDLYANLVIIDELKPEQFGAYGDSTHDDTAAIQSCIDYVSGKDIKLHLISKYLLKPTVTSPDNISRNICLQLKDRIIIEGNGNNTGFVIDDSDTPIYWSVFYSSIGIVLNNIVMNNFSFYQNDNYLSDIETVNYNPRYIIYTSSQIHGFYITNILFDHVYSRDTIMIIYNLTAISDNVKVNNCEFYFSNVLDRVNCSDCSMVLLDCKDYEFSNNILYGDNFTCIGGLELHGYNGTAKNNIIKEFNDCINIQPSGYSPANLECENNTLYGYNGIVLWESSTSGSGTGCNYIRILNNFIQLESGEDANDRLNGIRLCESPFTNPIENIIIENNQIEYINIDYNLNFNHAYSGGIVFNRDVDMYNLIIKNNIINNSISGGIKIGSTSGTATCTMHEILVKDNIIKNSGLIAGDTAYYDSSILFGSKYIKNIKVSDNIILNDIENKGSDFSFYSMVQADANNPCYLLDNIIKTVNSGKLQTGGISTWTYKKDNQIPIYSPNGTKYYIRVGNDGTLSAGS